MIIIFPTLILFLSQGPGDTSGGCRCNVNNQKCHPKCQNCHWVPGLMLRLTKVMRDWIWNNLLKKKVHFRTQLIWLLQVCCTFYNWTNSQHISHHHLLPNNLCPQLCNVIRTAGGIIINMLTFSSASHKQGNTICVIATIPCLAYIKSWHLTVMMINVVRTMQRKSIILFSRVVPFQKWLHCRCRDPGVLFCFVLVASYQDA